VLVAWGFTEQGEHVLFKRGDFAPAAVARVHRSCLVLHELRQLRNPAITIGQMFSDTFAGVAPASVPGFIVAQLIGGLLAVVAIWALYPDVTRPRPPTSYSHTATGSRRDR